ncbi:hypothetical protein CHOED_072 [Vibrio phage CHOED]|uniref:hypothetical protein n=1 Tax=Vibrio phage CHOED TaxID=1458716 RepID=UPI0004948719|nr:hypothetical protein CHOED_072 [Vibrio phage CHOED]AHK11932.2 hypothetical protein CHOED_072 [Vibrio phage CHOED]
MRTLKWLTLLIISIAVIVGTYMYMTTMCGALICSIGCFGMVVSVGELLEPLVVKIFQSE